MGGGSHAGRRCVSPAREEPSGARGRERVGRVSIQLYAEYIPSCVSLSPVTHPALACTGVAAGSSSLNPPQPTSFPEGPYWKEAAAPPARDLVPAAQQRRAVIGTSTVGESTQRNGCSAASGSFSLRASETPHLQRHPCIDPETACLPAVAGESSCRALRPVSAFVRSLVLC